MTHVYQIMTWCNRFSYELDDYVLEQNEGALYSTREEAEKHKAWLEEDGNCNHVEVWEVAVRDKFEKKK